MWGMRRIQFYLLKIGKTPLIKRRKLHVLCMSCISAPFVYLKMFAREWRGAFFRRGGNKSRLSRSCPRWPDAVTARQSSPHPTFSPCLLVWCFSFFFPFPSSFHLLITVCTQPTQIKEQLQSRSRKLELKGFSLSFYLLLLLSPRFSTLLFKQLRPSRGAERGDVLPEPGRSLFTFPFFFFFWLYLAETVLSRVPGPGYHWKQPPGSGARERDWCPSRGLVKIRNAEAGG